MSINPTNQTMAVSAVVAEDFNRTFRQAFTQVLHEVGMRGYNLCQNEKVSSNLVDALLISFSATPAAQLLTFMLSGSVDAIANCKIEDGGGANKLQAEGMSDAQYDLLVQTAQALSFTIEEQMIAQKLDSIFSIKISVKKL